MPKDANTAADLSQGATLFNSLREVDRRYTKKITGKSYSGDSPNPTWVILKITEALGPIGQDWGFNVVRETIHDGAPHLIPIRTSQKVYKAGPDDEGKVMEKTVENTVIFEKMHQVEIEFWRIIDGDRRTFTSFGGTPLFYMTAKGKWINDEDAAKKSLTDAYVKAASWLGVAGDLFLGLFDDRYSQHSDDAGTQSGGSAGAPPPSNGSAGDGWGNPPTNGGQRTVSKPDF